MTSPALQAFLARRHDRIGLDLGCGDARATARWAAAEPGTLVVGIDANLDAATRAARRAGRPLAKGGLPNLTLVRAAVEALPAELDGLVDELRVDLPWGTLLEGVLALSGSGTWVFHTFARLLAPGGAVRIALNARALPEGLSREAAEERLRQGLESVGLGAVDVRSTAVTPRTAWGKRLAGGRPLDVVLAEARRGERRRAVNAPPEPRTTRT